METDDMTALNNVKVAGAALLLMAGNVRAFAYSFDAGVWSAGISGIGVSIVAVYWAISQAKTRAYTMMRLAEIEADSKAEAGRLASWEAREAARLKADVERDQRMKGSMQGQIEDLKAELALAKREAKHVKEEVHSAKVDRDEIKQSIAALQPSPTETTNGNEASLPISEKDDL